MSSFNEECCFCRNNVFCNECKTNKEEIKDGKEDDKDDSSEEKWEDESKGSCDEDKFDEDAYDELYKKILKRELMQLKSNYEDDILRYKHCIKRAWEDGYLDEDFYMEH